MHSKTILAVLVSSACLNGAHAADPSDFERYGDAMQFILPLAGLGATYLADDAPGRRQFMYSFATAIGTTTVLKGAYGKMRPHSSSKTSYPSGHTTAAFQGAGFIASRYGNTWGIPAYVLAALTGASRLDSDHHFADDVLAGASIGLMSNWYWVTPKDQKLSVLPGALKDGMSLTFNYNPQAQGAKDQRWQARGTEQGAKWRYEMRQGVAKVRQNSFQSRGAAPGTAFDLYDFDKQDDPTVHTVASLQWFFAPKQTLNLSLAPFEVRDIGRSAQPVSFAGSTFAANTTIAAAWRMYDLSLSYSYDLVAQGPWALSLGGGLSALRTKVTLVDATSAAQLSDTSVLPFLLASSSYALSNRWALFADLDWASISKDKYLHANTGLNYRFDKFWDASFGVGRYERDLKAKSLHNKASYNLAFIALAYSFY